MKRAIAIALSTTMMIMTLAGLLMFVDPVAAQETYTATPVADAWVRSDQPNNTFNTFNLLYYDSLGATEYYSFMRFGDRPAAAAAELNLYVSLNNAPMRLVDSGYFDETTVTYNNAPALGFVFVSSHTITSTGYTKVDITVWWNNGGESLAILSEPDENVATYLGSSEYAVQKPFVEYELMPTATPMPTAVPPEPEPQLTNCYDFDTDNADFFGGPAWNVPIDATYDGSVSTGLVTSYSGSVAGQSIEIWATDLNEIEIQAGLGDIYAEPEQSGHVVVVVNDSSADVYHNGVLLESIAGSWGSSFSSVSALAALSIDQILVWDGAIDPAARYAAGPLPCVDQIDPTSVTIGRQLISLPSGKLAAVDYQLSAGEIFLGSILLIITFVLLWPQLSALANFNSKR